MTDFSFICFEKAVASFQSPAGSFQLNCNICNL
jgi:hypothetical protein